MNLELFNLAADGVTAIGSFLIKEDQARLDKHAVGLLSLTDEELRAACLRALRGEDVREARGDEGMLPALASYVTWFKRRASPLTIDRIAVAVEAFKRAPADLPEGSKLYPQQVQAALSLTRRCLIQMDTGEGKTYALLPAAFALAAEYHRVYILCANDYLAWRDAHRTRAFWGFVGMQHSLCLGAYTDDWSSRVIYTTLHTLVSQHVNNLARTTEPPEPLSFGAILLDEADSILLDEGSQAFVMVKGIKAEAFDWSFALDYVQSLKEGEEVETDYSDLTASLTVAGETRLRETLGQNASQESAYLLTRLAVELAYVGVRVAVEDRDYIVEDGRIYSIDPITGKVLRNRSPHWVTPLEVQKGLSSRAEDIVEDKITTLTFLEKFQHLSGLSGTIADDALEYLFLYFLPTLVIRPRRKRHKGIKPDLVYRTKEEAREALCEEVAEAFAAGRPVLVGTQNIADAEMACRMLSDKLPAEARIELLTGKNDHEAAQIFEHGGEVGSIIVATQLAGRGVDIRLTEEARRNGGLALFCLGHSRTIRHDKQFIGRAGRQGDPFNARFVCSLQDETFRMFTPEWVEKLMPMFGMERGVAIESKMVTKRLTSAQNNYRRKLFWQNQQQAFLNATWSSIRQSLETWFEYLQIPLEDGAKDGAEDGKCSREFLEWVVDFYLENVLAGALQTRKTISASDAEMVADFLNVSLGIAARAQQFSALDIESRDAETAKLALRQLLLKKLGDASEEHHKVLASAKDAVFTPPPRHEWEDPADENGEVSYRPDPAAVALFLRANDRPPRRVAFWSIRLGWIGFMQESSRIIHRVSQKRLSHLEHYRSLTDQITSEWQKTEKEIATRVLRNLLQSGRPLALDDLFIYEDNSVASSTGTTKDKHFHWEAGAKREGDVFDPKENIRLLIGQFVAQAADSLNEGFNASNLRRMLDDFTEPNPLYLLQSPQQIQKALEAWYVAENERGFSTARQRLRRKWLREFLLFLRERKLVGALPTLHTRLQSALSKFVKTVTETRTVLTSLGVVAFLAFFVAAVYWGGIAQPKQLGPFGAALDQLLFGGLLARGNIAAPAFGVLILASVVTVFIFPGAEGAPKDTVPFQRGLAPLLYLAFAWWLTDWQYGRGTSAGLLRSLVVFSCILAVSLITKRVAWLLENSVGLSLIAGWLCVCLLFVFLPAVFGAQPLEWGFVAIVGGIAAAYYLWQRFNSHEIELVSTLFKSSSISMQVEELSGNLKVKADCGTAPHVYGLLCAWLLYEFLTLNAVSARVTLGAEVFALAPAAVYMVVLACHIVYIMNRRFSPEMWQADLNSRHQTIKDVRSNPELRRKLGELKGVLRRRELAFQGLVFVGVYCLMYPAVLPGTAFPLSLFVVFAAFLFGVNSKTFGQQLYKLLYNRTPLDIEVLDFSKVPEGKEKRHGWKLLMRAAKITFAVLLSVYGFFEVVTGTYSILEKLRLLP